VIRPRVASLIEVSAICATCKTDTFFGVRFERPPTAARLREAVIAKLGRDGDYICPRCQSLVLVHVGEQAIAAPARVERAEIAQRIGRKDGGIRFAVGSPTGARSSVWRVWMNNRRDDVYIAARSLASQLKVSLHPEFWYFGFTKPYAERNAHTLPDGFDRKRAIWDRPSEFGPGWTRAFSIVVPATEVVTPPAPYSGSEVVWFDTPDQGEATHFTVLLSKPEASKGRRGFPSLVGFELETEFVTRLEMSTGEALWVVAHVAPTPSDDAEQFEQVRRAVDPALLRPNLEDDEDFSWRLLIFADSPDGAAHFIDLALDPPERRQPAHAGAGT
jgi:hypothetical protein